MQRFSTWLMDVLGTSGYSLEEFCSHSGIALERLESIGDGSLPDVNEMCLIVETLSRHTKRPPSWFYMGWHDYGWIQFATSKKKELVGILAEGDPERVRDLHRLTWRESRYVGNNDKELVRRQEPANAGIDQED